MKRIAIFQANLNVGGIQRSLVNLLKSDILKNHKVDVYLFSRDIFFDISGLSSNITINFIDPFPYWYRFIPFRLIRKICTTKIDLNNYDIAIDYDSYRQECAFYTTSCKNAKKIMWIHNDMGQEYKFNKKFRILYSFFKDKYKYFDEFVAVSEGVIKPFRRYSKMDKSEITVIPNIIDAKKIMFQSRCPSDVRVDKSEYNIACVGRIYVQKGYDILLEDFMKAYQKRTDLHLYIIGDGPDKEKYMKWVNDKGIQKAVTFLGNRENPFNILTQMDAFCLESRYEGQGMVLWEAKVLGLQLVFPKRLEKYNIYLEGTNDVVKTMVGLEKKEKEVDLLDEYQNYIRENFVKVLK